MKRSAPKLRMIDDEFAEKLEGQDFF